MGTQLCRYNHVIPLTLLGLIFPLKSRMMIWTLLSRAQERSFVMDFKETYSKKLVVTAGSPNLWGSLKFYAVFTIVSHLVPKMHWGSSEDTMKEPLAFGNQFLKETMLLSRWCHYVHRAWGDVVSAELEIDAEASTSKDTVWKQTLQPSHGSEVNFTGTQPSLYNCPVVYQMSRGRNVSKHRQVCHEHRWSSMIKKP